MFSPLPTIKKILKIYLAYLHTFKRHACLHAKKVEYFKIHHSSISRKRWSTKTAKNRPKNRQIVEKKNMCTMNRTEAPSTLWQLFHKVVWCCVKMQKSMNRPIIEKKYITKKAKLIEPQIKKLVNWTISRKNHHCAVYQQ